MTCQKHLNSLQARIRHRYRKEVLIPEVESNLDYTKQVSGVDLRPLTMRQYVLYLRYARKVLRARQELGNAFYKTLTPEQTRKFSRGSSVWNTCKF